MGKNRIEYIDLLRVCAVFFVIMIHVSSSNFGRVDPRSLEWNVFNFFDSISRWSVPVFFMISGNLFLNRDVEIKKLYGKYIKRLVICFLLWNVIYALWHTAAAVAETQGDVVIFRTVFRNFASGQVHLWFIPTMIGLYMIVPMLRQLVMNRVATRYFLIISFIFAFAIPGVLNIAGDFLRGNMFFFDWINRTFEALNLKFVMGMTFYFVLGYYLIGVNLSSRQKNLIYLLGIIGFVSTVALNGILAWMTQTPCCKYYEYNSLNVMLEALAVFVLAKSGKYQNAKCNRMLSDVAKYVFGIYLVHMLLLSIITRLGVNTVSFTPFISIPLISVIVFLGSFVLAVVMYKIPFVKKWMM